MRAVFVRMLAEQYGEAMAAVRCPVELLWGEDDTEVPVEVAERARGLFPSATLTVAPRHRPPAPHRSAPGSSGRPCSGGDDGDRRPGPRPISDDDPLAGPVSAGA